MSMTGGGLSMIACDSPQLSRGNPGGSGADPGSAHRRTRLASPHPSTDPAPRGQGGDSSGRGHSLPEEPRPQLSPGGEGTARPRVHTHAHTHPESAGVSETFRTGGGVTGKAQFGGPHHQLGVRPWPGPPHGCGCEPCWTHRFRLCNFWGPGWLSAGPGRCLWRWPRTQR